MMLQKKRFNTKNKKHNGWDKRTADEKLKIFKNIKNNNVPVNK